MRTLFFAAVVVSFALVTSSASANYPGSIPNGFSSPGVGRCGICHVSSAGGGTRTAFGMDFESASGGLVWSRWLAQRDSDGDGWTNGQELGDPFARWPGLAATAYRSNPGAAGSEPGDFSLCSATANNDCESTSNGGTCSSSSANGRGDWDCGCASGYSGVANERTSGYSSVSNPPYTIRVSAVDGCADVNECLTPNRCGTAAAGSCSNSVGSFTCTCNSGYTLVGGVCVDRNECTAIPGRCGMGTCFNNTGSFSCTCNAGFSFNGTTCIDNDLCNPTPCGANSTCSVRVFPMPGLPGFTCGCIPGYTRDGRLGCVDNDECATPRICGTGTCANIGGSYACTCPSGYEGSPTGGTCTDIDECVVTPGICGIGTCTDRAGSYTCTCPAGYLAMGGTCVNIDECATNPCGAGLCTEIEPGPGYACACQGGYTAPASGGTCTDVNECLDPAVSLCSPNASCANSVGAFTCTCNVGYTGDGRECLDVDECASDATNECDVNATCTDNDGSYDCACDAGWAGTGFLCADDDDCASGAVTCGVNEVCVNQVGATGLCECAPGTSRPTPGAACMAVCGDGLRTIGEGCDDGNTAVGDGCDAMCDIESRWSCSETGGGPSVCAMTCGDGLIDAGEECDDGPANSDTAPDTCRTICKNAGCNDGVVDTGEACDDGDDTNSDTTPDACRRTCVEAYCGDDVVDSVESCDPGGSTTPLPAASCEGTCTSPDAGTPADGGTGVDAGTGFDAGTTAAPLDDGGCGCRSAGASGKTGGSAALAALAVIALFVARRRRRVTRG